MDKTELMKLATGIKRSATGGPLLELSSAVVEYLGKPVEVSPVDARKAYRAYMKDYMAKRRAKKKERAPKVVKIESKGDMD